MSNVIIGSARSSYGHPEGGDQNGKEVSTQEFYLPSCSYWIGFEPISDELGNQIADNMQAACDNNNYGYNQPYRITGRQAYVKYGSIRGVKEPCCVDCSSLVNLCLYASGHNVANFNTASEPSVLRNTGLFKEIKVTKASDIKKRGTILVTPTKGHTVVVTKVSTSASTQPTLVVPTARPNLKKGSKGENVKKLQKCLNYVLNLGLVEDGIFGFKTDSALRSFQHKYGLVIDGIYGKNSKAKLQEVIG